MEKNQHNHANNHLGVKRYYIKNLVTNGLTVAPYVTVESVFTYMKQHEEVVGICMVEKEQAIGVITR